MKNPDWAREELILALDLYFKLDYGQMHARNPKIIELSNILRQLNIFKEIPDPNHFRSVNSVSLKLANFKKFDHNFTGKGMRGGANHDREIWNEYHKHRDKLKNEAEIIKQIYIKKSSDDLNNLNNTDDKSINTTNFLSQYHLNKETDPLAIKMKFDKQLIDETPLRCEVCTFDANSFYGELGNNFMEIHYNKELYYEPSHEPSKMEDFIIVCSNCHKILNSHYGLINAVDLKHIIKAK